MQLYNLFKAEMTHGRMGDNSRSGGGRYFRLTAMGFTDLNLFSVSSNEIPENVEFV